MSSDAQVRETQAGEAQARRAAPLVALAVCAVTAPLMLGCPLTLSRPESQESVQALAEGDRHAHHGRVEDATSAYERSAQTADRRVDRDEALYRQSRVLRRDGQYAEAVEILDRIAATEPPSRRTARSVYDASRLRIQHLDQRAEGLSGLRRVLLEFSSDGPAARALYYILEDFEAREDAAGALAFLRETYPRVRESTVADDILDAEAHLLLEAGERAGARAALERIVRDHPYPQGHRWDDALWQLADLAEEDGDAEGAIARLEEIVHRDENTMMPGSYTLSTFPRAQLRIARLYRDALSDHGAAAREFRQTFSQFPDSTVSDDAMVELGELYLDGGEASRGCHTLVNALERWEVGRARRRALARLEGECPEDHREFLADEEERRVDEEQDE